MILKLLFFSSLLSLPNIALRSRCLTSWLWLRWRFCYGGPQRCLLIDGECHKANTSRLRRGHL